MPHPLRFADHPGQIFLAGRIQLGAVVLHEHIRPAVNAAQRRAQVVADRVGKTLQLSVDGFEVGGAFADALLQFGVEFLDFRFRLLALGDVADAALDILPAVALIDGADEFHFNPPPGAGFQCQVLVADVFLLLQLREVLLVGDDVLEKPQLPDFLAQKFLMRETQQLDQEWIYIHDHPRPGIDDQDAVLGRFEEPAIADLRSAQRRFRLFVLLEQSPFTQGARHGLWHGGKGFGGFDDVIQRAGPHHFHHGRLVTKCGHDEDGERRVRRRMRENLRGAAVRQIQIHQRKIRQLRDDHLPIFPQRARDAEVDLCAVGIEGAADGLRVGGFVFHDQQMKGGGIHKYHFGSWGD